MTPPAQLPTLSTPNTVDADVRCGSQRFLRQISMFPGAPQIRSELDRPLGPRRLISSVAIADRTACLLHGWCFGRKHRHAGKGRHDASTSLRMKASHKQQARKKHFPHVNAPAVARAHPAYFRPARLRLIVQRKTPEATEATRLALRRAAIKKGKKLDPRSLIAAEFMILATSLPQTGYTAKDVLAVYRLRWQIELAFKRLKSLLHIDRLPTRTEPTSRSWLYAHLILALLCDDLSQDFLNFSP